MPVDAMLYIKWDNANTSLFNNDNDKATLIIYNPAKRAFVYFEAIADRGDKEVILQLPAKYSGNTVHCCQHFVNDRGNMVSMSVYVGEVVVG